MKLLAEITERSLGLSDKSESFTAQYRLRKSARGIVTDPSGRIAVQHIKRYDYHKLPGGGFNDGEDPEQALRREILEEVGWEIDDPRPVGVILEYHPDLIHLSYCFAAVARSFRHDPQLEADEIENQQVTVWMDPGDCLETLKIESTTATKAHFILQREITFLTEYMRSRSDLASSDKA